MSLGATVRRSDEMCSGGKAQIAVENGLAPTARAPLQLHYAVARRAFPASAYPTRELRVYLAQPSGPNGRQSGTR